MKLDRQLDSWDYDFVLELVKKHDFEPGGFDFKEALVGSGSSEHKRHLMESITKTACGMANAGGGYIVFGVKDRRHSETLSRSERCVGIPLKGDHAKVLGDRLDKIQPEVHFEASSAIGIPGKSDKCLFVAYVPQSHSRPHMFESVFHLRGPGGSSDCMNVYQVRDQVLETQNRFTRAALLLHELAQWRSLSARLGNWKRVKLRFDDSSFRYLVFQCHDLIPAAEFSLYVELGKVANAGTMANGAIEEVQKLGQTGEYLKELVGNAKLQVAHVKRLAFESEQELRRLLRPILSSQSEGYRALSNAIEALGLHPYTSRDFFNEMESGRFNGSEEDLI